MNSPWGWEDKLFSFMLMDDRKSIKRLFKDMMLNSFLNDKSTKVCCLCGITYFALGFPDFI